MAFKRISMRKIHRVLRLSSKPDCRFARSPVASLSHPRRWASTFVAPTLQGCPGRCRTRSTSARSMRGWSPPPRCRLASSVRFRTGRGSMPNVGARASPSRYYRHRQAQRCRPAGPARRRPRPHRRTAAHPGARVVALELESRPDPGPGRICPRLTLRLQIRLPRRSGPHVLRYSPDTYRATGLMAAQMASTPSTGSRASDAGCRGTGRSHARCVPSSGRTWRRTGTVRPSAHRIVHGARPGEARASLPGSQ